jgi:hypothetical protein
MNDRPNVACTRRLEVGRPGTVLVAGFISLLISLLAVTTAIGAALYTYDAPTNARVDALLLPPAEASPAQLSAAQEVFASPSIEPRGTSTTSPRAFPATEAVDANVVMGRKGSEMLVESGMNVPGVVNGRAYSAHAFDQMQGRGIMPSVVDDTIATGVPAASPGATTVYYGANNNISVVVNAEGKVVTVSYGDLRP